jgi:hypothetical protein
MAPTLVREPFHRAGWVYEDKVDGCASWPQGRPACPAGEPQRADHTKRLAGVAAAGVKLSTPRTLVLDGEVVIYDQQLRSRFERLRETDQDAVATPPVLMAFAICTATAAT